MHPGPIAFIRLFWFRLNVWLRLLSAGTVLAAGLLLRLPLVAMVGALMWLLTLGQAGRHLWAGVRRHPAP